MQRAAGSGGAARKPRRAANPIPRRHASCRVNRKRNCRVAVAMEEQKALGNQHFALKAMKIPTYIKNDSGT